MHITEELAYGETNMFQIVALPYDDQRTEMIIVLPKQSNCRQILTHLQQNPMDGFDSMLKALAAPTLGSLSLPKLDLEYGIKDIGGPLQALGLHSLQEKGVTVLHKAMMKMDEEGTTAAAVMALTVNATAVQVVVPTWVMHVNKPFLCFILNQEAGVPLFTGHIIGPP
eukprot:TRINITY_DN87191_c0_g1_i1.p1 TRINITY_DN87191_c0_g1~~TRINITY_DN87191_c0_g1_i1.p1  ORF type:complete len:188 (-),score=19.43 TRINITY_DN87191_c0_g1_i1:86-589(-)